MAYPLNRQTFSNAAGTSPLSNPDHAAYHGTLQNDDTAIQDVLGTTNGTSVLKHFAAGDLAVRATGVAAIGTLQQTLVGGTLSLNSIVFNAGAVAAADLATGAIFLGSASIVSSYTGGNGTTGEVDITGLSVTVTVPTTARGVEIQTYMNVYNNIGTSDMVFRIKEGAGTLSVAKLKTHGANEVEYVNLAWTGTASAGAHTYKVTEQANVAGPNIEATATEPAYIVVKAL